MTDWSAPRGLRGRVSGVPRMPGLDGVRALAVVAVMAYHANPAWLHGGFLGVEVFFVISGYLITLLLIAEHERTGRVDLRQFWLRRFRRLLPALFVMLSLLVVYVALGFRRAQGRTRGDILAAVAYVANWQQIWVGAGYTAAEAFAPLRHLWSLAVEEQFYLLWPIVMVAILARGRERLPRVALWLVGIATLLTVVMAVLFVPGDIPSTCSPGASRGYWRLGGRCVSVNDALYLSTVTRAGGLLLGAAFAMVWRPMALLRGPMRGKGHLLDVLALVGLTGLAWLAWRIHLADPAEAMLTGSRFDPLLFRGGFLLTGVCTLLVIAAVTHRRAWTGRVLGTAPLRWAGTRSYGLYLFHWPIYQIIRREAGVALRPWQLVVALALTVPLTEASYRLIEMPIRRGRVGEWLRRDRRPVRRAVLVRRRRIAGAALASCVVLGFSVTSIAIAPERCVGAIECDSLAGEEAAGATPIPIGGPPAPVTVAPIPTSLPTGATVATSGVPTSAASPTVTTAASAAGAPLPDAASEPPPTTPAAPPVTTLPALPYLALGESVMLGARPKLEARGILTDAEVNRGPSGILERLALHRGTYELTNAVVLQVGTNGPVSRAQYDLILAQASDVPLVVMMTVRAPGRGWIAGNNDIIRSLPATYPNVRVLDWEARAPEVEADLSGSDGGVHLRTDWAKEFYANLVAEAVGLR